MNFKAEDFRYMSRKRINAFKTIAKELGEDHPVTKMMGSRAWGRHDDEEGGTMNKQTATICKASLDGAFSIISTWARDNDSKAHKIIRDTYPAYSERCP